MTVEVGTEVSHAALRTVHIRHGLFKAQCAQHRAQRLAGLGRINGQCFALEVQFTIFHRGRPGEGVLNFGGFMTFFELVLFIAYRFLVLVLTEQWITRFDVVNLLHAYLLSRTAHLQMQAQIDRWATRGRPHITYAAAFTASGSSFFNHGALILPQHGLFKVMSMSRAKMAKPS